ncbi:MAG: ABC-type nitrate/sulfonate/bicarbonate transport system ATPase subunit [Myxococcota bacterium]|jgi:ABC-type nitrate/sulfonate/bicarbonate transport system ATPase subunit
MALMAASGLSVALGGRDIFAGVSLSVEAGAILSVIGPSGCGKTTLLRALAGLTPTHAGTITSPVDEPERAGVRMVFQDPRLLPWMTVRGNIGFALEAAGIPSEAWDDRITPLLKIVGLSDAQAKYPRQLSGGMAQRVALVRALAVRPRVLLLDEPFAALDPQRREQLQDDLQTLVTTTGCAAIIVTHDVMEALVLGDEVVVLAGSIQRRFTVSEPRPRGEVFRQGVVEVAAEVRAALREVGISEG